MTVIAGPTSHRYISQRLRLHYVDWGNPEAPPLLLIHGARDHCRNWDWVAEALRKDYHIIAPDLRGHGDSQWITGGTYNMSDYVYDIAQLVHQLDLAPLTIVGHSMGGGIALNYTGLYPDTVKKIIAIEGLGPSPKMLAERKQNDFDAGLRDWVDQLRGLAGRKTRRYVNINEAIDRMQTANPHLSQLQAEHLTVHGVNQNEDGSFSWKFDNYTHAFSAAGFRMDGTNSILEKISCPVMLMRGTESWASNPLTDGRSKIFQDVRVENVEQAGHWLHHDQLQVFLSHLDSFL